MRGWETGRIDEVEAGGEHQRGCGFYVPAHTLTVYVKVEIYAFQGELIETRESLCRAPDPSTAGRHQQWMSFHIPADWTYSLASEGLLHKQIGSSIEQQFRLYHVDGSSVSK
jgi:hypothetical protein